MQLLLQFSVHLNETFQLLLYDLKRIILYGAYARLLFTRVIALFQIKPFHQLKFSPTFLKRV